MSLPTPLRKARLLASKHWPYFSAALWRVGFYEAHIGVGPMAIDKQWRVAYDPEWLTKLTLKQLAFCMAHEINHCLRAHHTRVGERNALVWNIASDMEINDDLAVDKSLDVTSPGFSPVFPHMFNLCTGQTAEKYYEALKKQAKQMQASANCGSGCHGQAQDHEPKASECEGVPEHEQELIKHEVARAIQAGTEPGKQPLWVKETLNPVVDWRKALARYVRAAGQIIAGCTDYSYLRPSRRQWKPIVLPRMVARRATLGIVMDTSGSMGGGLLEEALAEVKGIAKAGNMDSTVYFCDAEVAGKGRAGDAGLAKQVRGGGGTNMGVGIVAALAARPKPDVIVVLTDGYTPWPAAKPVVPVIVGIVGERNPFDPFNHLSDKATPAWASVVKIVR